MSAVTFKKVRDLHASSLLPSKKYLSVVERAVMKRDNYRCVYCNSGSSLTIDHVIPRSSGGSDDKENLATCCKKCNCSKGTKPVDEYLEYIEADVFAYSAMMCNQDAL